MSQEDGKLFFYCLSLMFPISVSSLFALVKKSLCCTKTVLLPGQQKGYHWRETKLFDSQAAFLALDSKG